MQPADMYSVSSLATTLPPLPRTKENESDDGRTHERLTIHQVCEQIITETPNHPKDKDHNDY
jgi:hypothetical protein